MSELNHDDLFKRVKAYCDGHEHCMYCKVQHIFHRTSNIEDECKFANETFTVEEIEKAYEIITGERWTDNPKIHPEHYNNTKITPFDVIDDWKLDFYLGTAIKYIKRAGSKDGESVKDDLEKAIDYLKEEVKRL